MPALMRVLVACGSTRGGAPTVKGGGPTDRLAHACPASHCLGAPTCSVRSLVPAPTPLPSPRGPTLRVAEAHGSRYALLSAAQAGPNDWPWWSALVASAALSLKPDQRSVGPPVPAATRAVARPLPALGLWRAALAHFQKKLSPNSENMITQGARGVQSGCWISLLAGRVQ